jgi:hypothetical protein
MAETRIAFETDDSGVPTALRVFSESAERMEPLSVYALLDGKVLRPDGDDRYPLPEYDWGTVHIVSAEATFLDGLTARSDVTFGGPYGSQVATELTAIPIVVEGGAPKEEELRGAFVARGNALRVAAVEQPASQLFMVRDHATLARLSHLRQRQDEMNHHAARWRRELMSPELTPADDRLRMVVPNPTLRRDRMLFPTTEALDLERWGLPWLATHLTSPEAHIFGQKLADAVAVAGVRAAGGASPRAVILILTSDSADASDFSAEEVRDYLSELRVPLFVWHTGGLSPVGWGDAVDISTRRGLGRATRIIRRELDHQWIVWLEGKHMVNEIELVRDIPGVRLAGEPLEIKLLRQNARSAAEGVLDTDEQLLGSPLHLNGRLVGEVALCNSFLVAIGGHRDGLLEADQLRLVAAGVF